MLKAMTASFLLLCGTLAYAAQPAAPLSPAAAQEIANVFKDRYESDFKREMSRTHQMAFPTKEQSVVYSKYMNKAFSSAGYSLDATLNDYLHALRTPGVILFMSKLNLETYAISLKSEAVGGAFMETGAISQKTFDYARDIAREVPISNADYIFQADPGYRIAGIEGLPQDYEHREERLIGYVQQGSEIWDEWLYFESASLPGEEHGMGLVDLTKVTPEEMQIWKALLGKKVKLEGTYFTARGIELGSDKGTKRIRNPNFFDLKQELAFKVL